MSTKFNSDFLSQTIYDSLLRFKIYQIFNKFPQFLETKQKLFQETNIHEFKSIEFAINNKLRTLDEFKDLYQDGIKFRKWLSSIDGDSSLINEYYNEVSKQKWFEKLPVKSVKWALFTGAGIAIDIMGAVGLGTAGGIVLSASDEFYLDKLLSGWKPNLFIQGELNEFLNRK